MANYQTQANQPRPSLQNRSSSFGSGLGRSQNISAQQGSQIQNPSVGGSRPLNYHTSQYRGYSGPGTPGQYAPEAYHTQNYQGYSAGNAPQGNVHRRSSYQSSRQPVSDQAYRAVATGAGVSQQGQQMGMQQQGSYMTSTSQGQFNQQSQAIRQQLEQFRQNLNQISQMASDLAWIEQSNQQQLNELYQIELDNYRRLEQLSQQEAQASQQLQQIQQLCEQANQQFNNIASQVEVSFQ